MLRLAIPVSCHKHRSCCCCCCGGGDSGTIPLLVQQRRNLVSVRRQSQSQSQRQQVAPFVQWRLWSSKTTAHHDSTMTNQLVATKRMVVSRRAWHQFQQPKPQQQQRFQQVAPADAIATATTMTTTTTTAAIPPLKPQTPWPKSIRYTGYAVAATVVPYLSLWIVWSNPTLRNMLCHTAVNADLQLPVPPNDDDHDNNRSIMRTSSSTSSSLWSSLQFRLAMALRRHFGKADLDVVSYTDIQRQQQQQQQQPIGGGYDSFNYYYYYRLPQEDSILVRKQNAKIVERERLLHPVQLVEWWRSSPYDNARKDASASSSSLSSSSSDLSYLSSFTNRQQLVHTWTWTDRMMSNHHDRNNNNSNNNNNTNTTTTFLLLPGSTLANASAIRNAAATAPQPTRRTSSTSLEEHSRLESLTSTSFMQEQVMLALEFPDDDDDTTTTKQLPKQQQQQAAFSLSKSISSRIKPLCHQVGSFSLWHYDPLLVLRQQQEQQQQQIHIMTNEEIELARLEHMLSELQHELQQQQYVAGNSSHRSIDDIMHEMDQIKIQLRQMQWKTWKNKKWWWWW